MKRIPPSVRMKEEVTALLRGVPPAVGGGQAPMEGFVRATARYMLQVAIEAEATAFLAGGTTAEGIACAWAGATAVSLKACRRRQGLLELAVPRLRATEERFRPRQEDWDLTRKNA